MSTSVEVPEDVFACIKENFSASTVGNFLLIAPY